MHPSQNKAGSDHPPPRRILKRLNLFFLCTFLLLALVYMVRERLHENAIRKVLPALRAIDLGCEGISDAGPGEAREHFGLDPAGRVKVPGEGPLSGPESAELAEILDSTRCPAMSCSGLHYRLYPVDLNRDGVSEYVMESTECGSAGCEVALFMKQEGGWVKLAGLFGAVRVEEHGTNWFRNVTLSYKYHGGARDCEIKRVHLVWDGKSRYQVYFGAGVDEPPDRPKEASHFPVLTGQGDRHCYDFPMHCAAWPEPESP